MQDITRKTFVEYILSAFLFFISSHILFSTGNGIREVLIVNRTDGIFLIAFHQINPKLPDLDPGLAGSHEAMSGCSQ